MRRALAACAYQRHSRQYVFDEPLAAGHCGGEVVVGWVGGWGWEWGGGVCVVVVVVVGWVGMAH